MSQVNSNLTETSMLNLLLAAGAERVSIPTKYYFTLMGKQSGLIKTLWNERLTSAAPHFIKKGFRAGVHDLDSGVTGQVDWDCISSGLFVDMVLGLDCLVQLEDGTIIGVDCSTRSNEEVLNKKQQKLNKLKPLLEYLGIEAVVIAQVSFGEYGFAALGDAHKRRLIKNMKKVLNKDYCAKWSHRWALNLN